ncbi:GH25 family lysozyme [Levilactobacillus bambusae]|nr:GH25 family lysozyme [Levilactobacillus bambusae]
MKRRDIQPIYANTYRRLRRRRRWLIILILLLVAAGGIWMAHSIHLYHQKQIAQYPVQGVAIDQDAGYVDFQKLAAKKVQFVYIHATSGSTYVDDDFSDNLARSEGANDVAIGVYHVYSFSTSAAKQSQNFIKTVGSDSGSLPIVIQVEYYGDYSRSTIDAQKQTQNLKKLVQSLSDYYGKKVIIWTTAELYHQWGKNAVSTKNRYWQADGSLKNPEKQVAFVEFQPQGSMKLGNSSINVSRSVFNGTQKEWNKTQ